MLRYTDHIAAWPVAVNDYQSVRRAIDLSRRSVISVWDALIVVAADAAGAKVIYSEDLNGGQELLGVLIVNPFAAGGNTDIQARIASERLSNVLGQPFLVENRAA